jgi:hypothetical protein
VQRFLDCVANGQKQLVGFLAIVLRCQKRQVQPVFALEQHVSVITDRLQQPRLGFGFVLEIHVGGSELGAHKVLLLANLRAVALLLKLQVAQNLRSRALAPREGSRLAYRNDSQNTP